jgi:hypothetical protein
MGAKAVTNKNHKRPKFMLTLEPLPDVDPIRALRAALKYLLRAHGLRCIDLREGHSLELSDRLRAAVAVAVAQTFSMTESNKGGVLVMAEPRMMESNKEDSNHGRT